MRPPAAPHVAVVGAGVSGLAAAHRLRALLGPAARITVLEGRDRVGGVLRTVELAGVPMDVGAEAFLARRPEVPALLAELGLTGRVVHPGGAGPSVRAGGRTAALPTGTLLGLPGSTARLGDVLSAAGLARVAAEPGTPLRWEPGEDRPLGGLLRERYGDEVADRLVEPLLSGVYAGRVDALGLRATVPGLGAALDAGAASLTDAVDGLLPPPTDGPPAPVFGALRSGYGRLLAALRDGSGADVRLGLPVRALYRLDGAHRPGDGRDSGSADGSDPRGGRGPAWRLEMGAAAGPERLDVDAVLLAVPAPALRTLLADVAPEASRVADSVELASPVVVALAYRETDAAGLPDTSGVLIGADEPLHAKAFTHSARKWPHLAPSATDGLLRLRASLGRAGSGGRPGSGGSGGAAERGPGGAAERAAAALRVPDAELVDRVRADLATLTGITGPPVHAVVQRWGGGLPQYGVGHGERMAALERAVAELPGLAVAGATLRGVGVPACIGSGRAAAERIAAGLRRPEPSGRPAGSAAAGGGTMAV